MADDIPSSLLNEANKTVFGFIKDLSAHDNIASSLMEAVKPLGDVQIFCPDWVMYRYVIASTKNIVFGVAVGMDIIGFRLSPLFKSRALQTGGASFPELGPDWVKFLPLRSDWPAIDLRFWALKAYVNVRE